MEKKTSRDILKMILAVILIAAVSGILTYTQVFYSFDKTISDKLYQTTSSTNPAIKLITIDEKTLAEYGDVTDWSRDIPAQLVEILDADSDTAPAVIGFDVLYISENENDEEGDEHFAEACRNGGNVVTAMNLIYRTENTLNENNQLVSDKFHVADVEHPYESLYKATETGFANTSQDVDGYIRYTRLTADYNGETLYSLPAEVYIRYCAAEGLDVNLPETYSDNLFEFTFSGHSGDYEYISMADVMDGTVSASVFDGCIVLVGAYASGMQDAYNVANQKGAQMYGVEIHANILEAIMEGKTQVPMNTLVYTLIVVLIAVAFYLLTSQMTIIPATVLLVVLIAADLITGKFLYVNGTVMEIIELPIFLIVIYAYQLVLHYLQEILKRRKVVSAFKKYVAPQVVDEISKKGEFKIVLGGEKRHIACLFVDIRGFTTMSEGLDPEDVVQILNEYLSLTTNSIFKNGGTLDKFIGDATMAVFNAPFDLDDYIYRAVCTARDIAAGSEELEKKLMEKFGRSVSFGIGVNCGDAVVGNIGCEFRMDYTAIGDTVNTASRLESNAKRGQILISDSVYEALKDRLEVTPIGNIPLKGKSKDVFVYQVDKVL